ncbi:hypothetical protein P4261_29015 [Bacillus thuringiensis]|nr:hypothetical protein [Bacillus thuringiensis]MED2810956.1 hypothetical protein [Bacillus thuringiensis]MED2828912.1 hypothetical protein [Bacillus thuringiensis]MED2852505.1 hypothetical protein [Bacillus thuringiensis]MED2855978.1 hypothetical protein [Bacillus thuringiensis]
MKRFSVTVHWIGGGNEEYVISYKRSDATTDDVEQYIIRNEYRFIKLGEELVNLDNILAIKVNEIGN